MIIRWGSGALITHTFTYFLLCLCSFPSAIYAIFSFTAHSINPIVLTMMKLESERTPNLKRVSKFFFPLSGSQPLDSSEYIMGRSLFSQGAITRKATFVSRGNLVNEVQLCIDWYFLSVFPMILMPRSVQRWEC